MTPRVAVAAVVLAAVAPGLLFTPVFGVAALVVPLLVAGLAAHLAAELAARWPALVPWRPVLGLFAGLLGLAEALLWSTTVGGVPTSATVRALAGGVTTSWQLTLQSTWPARPDPELLLFVPLAALAAAVLGVELLSRLRRPLVALLPGLAVFVLSQAYVALTGVGALVAGFGFAALAAALLAATRHQAVPAGISGGASGGAARRGVVAAALMVPTLVLGVAGAVLATAADPAERQAYSLREKRSVPLPPARVSSPLDEVADRLLDPDKPVFTYSTRGPVDRWRLVVLDEFNGVTWTAGGQYRRMGAALQAAPSVATPVDRRSASVDFTDGESPWVPSQAMPAAVSGLAPLIDEDSGMLVAEGRRGPARYDLSWWEPRLAFEQLYGAGVDPAARSGFAGLGTVPPGVGEVATKAVGGMRPSFQTALALERFLSDNYKVAGGEDLPTGNGWPQLSRFLLDTKRGTSEQFAAAYVVLARIVGIPARVAVGFRAPAADGEDVVVHNSDVLAWPEVAVDGVGWVALDPTGTAEGAGGTEEGGLAEATARARQALPPPDDIQEPELPADEAADGEQAGGDGWSVPWLVLGVVAAAVLLAWLGGVPAVRAVRRWRRRRRPGARAVVGAWHEARDAVRAHGVPFTVGMTVRDLAREVVEPPVAAGLHTLAVHVDATLWSRGGAGAPAVAESWAAVRAVRRGLRGRPLLARLRALLDVRTLFPPR